MRLLSTKKGSKGSELMSSARWVVEKGGKLDAACCDHELPYPHLYKKRSVIMCSKCGEVFKLILAPDNKLVWKSKGRKKNFDGTRINQADETINQASSPSSTSVL